MATGTSLDPKERFSFGKNWANFLHNLTEDKIVEAENSLKKNLNIDSLKGKTFLDIGSGSGLFSLAAFRLGAKVSSFDYDQDSVNCAKFLREKYANNDALWDIQQGSVLDKDFLKSYKPADVLYSWGVLHHTGHMHKAFENVAKLVKNDGSLFIAIYNDQGGASKRWLWIKKKYVYSKSAFFRNILCLYTAIRQWSLTCIKDTLKSGNPFKTWFSYGKNNRGMSPWHDIVDWTGGYPFEVATPEAVFYFFKEKGFSLEMLKTCAGGLGCNEFVFKKNS